MSVSEIDGNQYFYEFADDELKIYKAPSREGWLKIRKRYVCSTEMAPVCGISKYGVTAWSVHMEKRGVLDSGFVASERSEVGQILEHGIARLAAKRLGVKVRKVRDFMARGPLGSSFDYEIVSPGHELDGWLLEIKSVDFMIYRDQWIDGNPPEHITIQTQTQLEVSRRPGTVIAALVGGNDLKILRVLRDAEMGADLRAVADQFWLDVESENEPELRAEDSENVARLHGLSDPSKTLDARGDYHLGTLAAQYFARGQQIKALEEERSLIKAQLLAEVKDSAKLLVDGYTVDLGNTVGSQGTLITPDMVGTYVGERKGFRRFVVREKK